ncbi:DUF2911 domain-containing protein [Gillisia sp. CAL575]|uniref:DUF2911 domain-containing protein n=1 Tax=Gillisia sp. CAL575 TaxID=985255 RepID=UPI000399EE87|nr:DUF2911 domain-containing protein [Gillisia sp. CAL575]
MKKTILTSFIAIISLAAFSQNEHANHNINAETKQDSTTPKKVLSPHTSAMAMVGDAHVHIDYSSPSVRNRMVFGGLVGYNTVWQAGAHKATWIETNKNLKIGGKTLPAGKYGFFLVPGKKEWKVMFNSKWDQHGKDEYSEAEDVLVTSVVVKTLDITQEVLTYKVNDNKNNKGVISLAWENSKIEIPFEVLVSKK